ncbi:MAG: phosphoadenosine phosphosulfate reductase family protein [Pseudomonadota bacterium]
MTVFEDISAISPELTTEELLRYLIKERFPGKTVVTASLKARSVVVLKLVADIDPTTPVVFCTRGFRFPESAVHRQRVVEQLGLTNVSQSEGSELEVRPGDHDHCESMWAESEVGTGRSYEIVHLNDTLAPYECWISAVYHVPSPPEERRRVDIEGRLVRVNPMVRWSKDEVRTYMRDHKLPYHPRALRQKPAAPAADEAPPPAYHF